jgi:hypothetical protein
MLARSRPLLGARGRSRAVRVSDTTVSQGHLKTLENGLGGRDRPDFGTVRHGVQIPGSTKRSYSRCSAVNRRHGKDVVVFKSLSNTNFGGGP